MPEGRADGPPGEPVAPAPGHDGEGDGHHDEDPSKRPEDAGKPRPGGEAEHRFAEAKPQAEVRVVGSRQAAECSTERFAAGGPGDCHRSQADEVRAASGKHDAGRILTVSPSVVQPTAPVHL